MSADGFDLDAVDPGPLQEQGVDMELLTPSNEPSGVILIVRGFDSPTYKAVVERHLRHRAEILPRKLTEEESKVEFYEENAALIAGWKGKPLKRGDQVISYTPANAAQLLRQYDYIVEQVRRFAVNRRNFLPGSAKV